MSINAELGELEKLRTQLSVEDAQLPFVIFMDEFQDESIGGKRLFTFICNIIRALRICFIAIGTNAAATNFSDYSTENPSRDKNVWSYLIFQSPGIAVDVFEDVKRETKETLSYYHSKDENLLLTEQFMDDFYNLFKQSRPLWLHYAFDSMWTLMQKNIPYASLVDFFWPCIWYIRNVFFACKGMMDDLANIGYFTCYSASYWNQIFAILENEDNELETDKKKRLLDQRNLFGDTDLLNGHMAYVGIPADAELKYGDSIIALVTKTGDITETRDCSFQRRNFGYISKNDARVKPFDLYSYFRSINDEPILGLILSVALLPFQPYLSTFAALFAIVTNTNGSFLSRNLGPDNGQLLELAVPVACIVLSYRNGFKGTSISEWFPKFLNELRFFSYMYDSECMITNTLVDSEEFIADWSHLHIPYLCPQMSAGFSREIEEKFKVIDPEAKFGIINSNIDETHESREFSLVYDGKHLINGECRLRNKELNVSD